MKLNYKKLGDYIQQVTIKNKDCINSKNDCNILSSRLNSHKKYH